MDKLDKYKITNKNSKFYGRYAWMVELPNENNQARFIVDSCVKLRMKMSSVQLVSNRHPDGFRFYIRANKRWYTIIGVSCSGYQYRVNGDGQWYNSSIFPWGIPAMKGTVV